MVNAPDFIAILRHVTPIFLDKPLFSSSKPTAAAAPVMNIWEERKKQQLIQVSLIFIGLFYYNFLKS